MLSGFYWYVVLNKAFLPLQTRNSETCQWEVNIWWYIIEHVSQVDSCARWIIRKKMRWENWGGLEDRGNSLSFWLSTLRPCKTQMHLFFWSVCPWNTCGIPAMTFSLPELVWLNFSFLEREKFWAWVLLFLKHCYFHSHKLLLVYKVVIVKMMFPIHLSLKIKQSDN